MFDLDSFCAFYPDKIIPGEKSSYVWEIPGEKSSYVKTNAKLNPNQAYNLLMPR